MKCQQHKEVKIETFIPVTIYICDNCKKGVSDNGEVMYGGSFLSNWFHLQKNNRKHKIRRITKTVNLGFLFNKMLARLCAR